MIRGQVIVCFLLIQLLLCGGRVSAQNLVPNPSFEDPTTCPTSYGQISFAFPWKAPTTGSTDYYHACAVPGEYSVPINNSSYQEAHSGDGYAGVVFATEYLNSFYREYVMTPLLEPLEGGLPYEVMFWINQSDSWCATSEFGAYFSVDPPPVPDPQYQGILDVVPQFKPEVGIIADTQNWVLLSGCFIAQGGEQFMTIGNFSSPENTPIEGDCPQQTAYYFIDDVSLVQGGAVEVLDIELGDPVLVCDEYLIDPGIPDVHYLWSDGSMDSTLLATTTGMYAVTIVSGCMLGSDSLEVTVHGQSNVEIGPEEINLCPGEAYVIELDTEYNDYIWQDGSTDPVYTITTSGLYSVTLDDGCQQTSDEINVNVIEPPEPFSINEVTVLCENEEIEFSFDPALGDFLWQDGSTSPEYYITDPGMYALTISNMCGSESAFVVISGLAPPVVHLGPDSVFLCTGTSYEIELDHDPDIHFFDWSDGSNGPDLTISNTGSYSVTVTNACGDHTDTIHVFFLSPPSFHLGPDTILCSGQDSLILKPGDFLGATYLWQDSSMSSTYVATATGTFSVSIVNNCGTDADTIMVNIPSALPPPDLGPDLMLCPGETHVLSPNIPDATYLWQDSSALDSFVITTAGTYFVQVANACSVFSDTVVVLYNALPPEVDLPQSATLCIGDSIVLDAGISGVSYLWNDGSSLSSLSVYSPGSYSLTVSNNCGSDADTVIVLDGGPAPLVELGNDIQLCEGDTIILSPAFSNVDTWLWNDGSALQIFDVITSGSISVSVSNACGVSYDTLMASLLPAVPSFTLGNDTSLCPGNTITLSINTPDVSILWSNGSSGNELIVTNQDVYFATISNSCGESADTIQVDVLPAVPDLDLGIDQSLCPGELIVIDPGIPDVNYVWQDGSTSNTYSTTLPETIILQISNACGSSTDTLVIIESTDGPQVDLGPDVAGCIGEIVTINSGISGVDYMWQDGSTASSFTTSVSGEIILTVSNNCGVDADTILVDLSGIAPYVDLGPDTTLCDGLMLLLEINALPVSIVEWQDGSSLQSYEVTAPGIYYVTSTNLCGEATDTIHVSQVYAPSPFNLGPDTILCPGEFLTLPGPPTSDQLTWQDGSHAPTMIADTEQTYSLQISNACGIAFDDLNLSIDNNVPVVLLDPEIVWCPGESLILDVAQSFPVAYNWNTGAQTPSITIVTEGSYAVTVTAPCAVDSGSTYVHSIDDCFPKIDLYLPNIFSPDNSGINDIFRLEISEDVTLTAVQGSIYDRWGNMVYQSRSIPFEWNGRFNDELLNPGVYVYSVAIEYLENGIPRHTVLTGDITLLR